MLSIVGEWHKNWNVFRQKEKALEHLNTPEAEALKTLSVPKLSALQQTTLSVKRVRILKERLIEGLLFLAAASSVVATLGIVVILVSESIPFFAHVSVVEFLTSTQWTPLFDNPQFGILPLLGGTFLTTLIAISVAIPVAQ